MRAWQFFALGLSIVACSPSPHLLTSSAPVEGDKRAVATREVCIGSRVEAAGRPPAKLYYKATQLDAQTFAIGYFVVFSEERPWGENWLTWTILPALLVDSVYSHTFFVAPGLQRAMYGRGDVEGVAMIYRTTDTGETRVERALADDARHRPVVLWPSDIFAIDAAHPVFYAEEWSHHLGARGARSARDLKWMRCYAGDEIVPLPDDVSRDYRLEARAEPAHVDRLVFVQ